MNVVFNMIDGSELHMNNVKSIIDVGRDLRITFDFIAMAPGTFKDMYIEKVGTIHKEVFRNCVTSYESEELGVVLVDYHFYDLNNNKLYTRNGVSKYKPTKWGGAKT